MSILEIQDLKQQSRCVAWRDVTAKPMYIEFFSEPRLKFEFSRSISYLNPYSKFSKLQQDIINAGWTTYDLS